MADLSKVKNENNQYVVTGKITDDDIDYFNSFEERTILIFENTKGLSSELISMIKNNNVVFSIVGGLNGIINSDNIDKKYKEKYTQRTYLSYMGLATILYYFEQIESELEYDWSDTQKAMYVYSVLASNIEYVSEFSPESFIGKNVMPRSLNGILYNKLTCAGFALVFKEMMDRLGIECYFQNKTGSHDFNIIKLNNNFYGIDVTWDNCFDKATNICEFKQFGRDIDFYNNIYHRKGVYVCDSLYEKIMSGKIKREEWTQEYLEWVFDLDYSKKRDEKHTHFMPFADDILFDIKVFSDDEYEQNLNAIKNKLLKRKKIAIHLEQSDEKTRKLFLPYDTVEEERKEKLEKDKKIIEDRFKSDMVKDYQMFKMYEYLSKYNLIDKKNCDVFNVVIECKKPYILDFVSDFSLENADAMFDHYNKVKKIEKLNDKDINDSVIFDLNKYLKDLIDELIEQMPIYINSYNLFKDTNDEYDRMVILEVYSKIKILLIGKDALMNLGYRSEEINKLYELYKNSFDKPKIIESNKEKDLEFIYEVFSDLDDVRSCIERYELRKLEDSEFAYKFTDVDYMMMVFDRLNEYDINKEEYFSLFSSIINECSKKRG